MVKQIEPSVTLSIMPQSNIGQTVDCALKRAQYESRVVIGLAAAVKELSTNGNGDVMFCLLAPPEIGDSATHMHTILLEAFCYENDIYIIKVDSAKKLSRILSAPVIESCALIQRPWPDAEHPTDPQFTAAEEAIVDHCEEFWDVPQQPIVTLPE